MTTFQQSDELGDMAAHFRELDDVGYTVLTDLMTPSQVAEAVDALKEIYEREKDVLPHELNTRRTFNLTARADIFRQLIQLPKLVACMEYLLGPDYILSDMGGRSPMPGVAPQRLHRDGVFFPNPPYDVHAILPLNAQSMFAFSEFTAAKGATRLVPGSHVKDIDLTTIGPDEEFLFITPPGSVLVFDNRLIHGGGPNTTNEIRYSAQGYCCRSFVKPHLDHTHSVPREIIDGSTPLLRRLWGFTSQCPWEESTRNFRIVDAPGARSSFPFGRIDTPNGPIDP